MQSKHQQIAGSSQSHHFTQKVQQICSRLAKLMKVLLKSATSWKDGKADKEKFCMPINLKIGIVVFNKWGLRKQGL